MDTHHDLKYLANFEAESFGGKKKAWIGGQGYPTSNISSFNMWRIKTAQLLGLMHRGRI